MEQEKRIYPHTPSPEAGQPAEKSANPESEVGEEGLPQSNADQNFDVPPKPSGLKVTEQLSAQVSLGDMTEAGITQEREAASNLIDEALSSGKVESPSRLLNSVLEMAQKPATDKK